MSRKKYNRRLVLFIVSGLSALLLVLSAAWMYINRQLIADHVVVWSFEPTKEVQQLERSIGFSNDGSFYFYVTQPVLASAQEFNANCPRQEVATPILGCYTGDRIFVYNIQNQQLAGIKEVTAAHEMLHAVWERMNEAERTRLEPLLMEVYKRNANQALNERMEYYNRTQPGEFYNELHSILPTEFSTLSPQLEDYYSRYFDDRQKVVSYYTAYNEVFTQTVVKIDTLYLEIQELGQKIEADRNNYREQSVQLRNDIASFNQRADNGSFSSMSQFNSERAVLVSRSSQLDAFGASITQSINQYNALIEEYDAIAGELDALNQSIDSAAELEVLPGLQ